MTEIEGDTRKITTPQIREFAIAMICRHPTGARFSDLHDAVMKAYPAMVNEAGEPLGTVRGALWDLHQRFPDRVRKGEERGMFLPVMPGDALPPTTGRVARKAAKRAPKVKAPRGWCGVARAPTPPPETQPDATVEAQVTHWCRACEGLVRGHAPGCAAAPEYVPDVNQRSRDDADDAVHVADVARRVAARLETKYPEMAGLSANVEKLLVADAAGSTGPNDAAENGAAPATGSDSAVAAPTADNEPYVATVTPSTGGLAASWAASDAETRAKLASMAAARDEDTDDGTDEAIPPPPDTTPATLVRLVSEGEPADTDFVSTGNFGIFHGEDILINGRAASCPAGPPCATEIAALPNVDVPSTAAVMPRIGRLRDAIVAMVRDADEPIVWADASGPLGEFAAAVAGATGYAPGTPWSRDYFTFLRAAVKAAVTAGTVRETRPAPEDEDTTIVLWQPDGAATE